MLPLIPWSWPANLITISTNLFLYLGLFLAVVNGSAKSNFLLLPLFILIYTIGDHMDGLQARRTKTGSPLGEFCDHYLDVFNTGIILFFVFSVYGLTSPAIGAIIMSLTYLGHTTVVFEKYKTGWLVFDRLGSLEGLVVTVALILAGLHPGIFEALTANGHRILILIMGIGALGGFGTFITVLRRIKSVSWRFLIHIAGTATIAIYAANHASMRELLALAIFYPAEYAGNLMRGDLADGKERMPDILVPLCCLAMLAIDLSGQAISRANGRTLNQLMSAYLALRIIWILLAMGWTLRSFWYWKNPPEQKTGN